MALIASTTGAKTREVDNGEDRVVPVKEHDGVRMKSLNDSAHSDDSNKSSDKKPMSVRSLSDHFNSSRDNSRDPSRGHTSEASPIDEESSGGWSDDDSATIKSEFTASTYGTLGSAIVIDATAMTSNQEATKKLRRMVATKAVQSKEDIIPGLPPSVKSSDIIAGIKPSARVAPGEEILFTPPTEDSDGSGENTKKAAGKASKKKKKKKSKKSVDRVIDVTDDLDDSDYPKRKKDRKKKKMKVATVQEDIVIDFNEHAATDENDVVDRSKKKKKKKKRQGNVGSSDDSNDFDSDEKQDSDDNLEKEKKKKKKKAPIEPAK
jgi:hypothetical protein